MAGKELAGLLVAGGGGEAGIDRGVLDVGMAQPVFDKGKVGAGVQEVGGDRVFKGMEFVLLGWEACGFAVFLHHAPEGAAVNGDASVRGEEVGGVIVFGVNIRA